MTAGLHAADGRWAQRTSASTPSWPPTPSPTTITPPWPASCSSWRSELQEETGCPHRLHQPVRRRGHSLPPRPEPTTTSPPSVRACAGPMRRSSCPQGMGDVAIFTELGRFMTGPYGCLVTTCHPRKAHLQGVHRRGRLRRQPDAARHVRRLPPHHRAWARRTPPATTSTTWSAACARTTTSLPWTGCCPRSTSATCWSSTTPAPTAHAMGYNYNGKLRSAEVLLCEDGSHRLIRRAETPRDYFATLDFLPAMKPLFEGYDD